MISPRLFQFADSRDFDRLKTKRLFFPQGDTFTSSVRNKS